MINKISFGNNPVKLPVPELVKEQIAMAAYQLNNSQNSGMRGGIQQQFDATNLVLTALANQDKLDVGNSLDYLG
ncbi:MAG: hypothetical protein AB1782_04780 [Cyanobacteriota bacterium]